MSSFGDRIVETRKRKNYSQRKLAELLGVTPTRLNYWEKNKREPDLHMLKKIAGVLGEDPNYLLGIDYEYVGEQSFSRDEIELIYLYRQITPESRDLLKSWLDLLVRLSSSGKE